MLQADSACKTETEYLHQEAIDLLKKLIMTPSPSREETGTALLIENCLKEKGVDTQRKNNNIWARNRHFKEGKPVILLNSHHDTVKPNPGYTLDPYAPVERDGKLYGLGSNDAGASLVALLATFIHFYEAENLKYNFIFAATAEEEISGINGIECLLPELGKIDFAIVGEPTEMHLAIAEKGLLVLDCVARGKSGHAARDEGDNAIYRAFRDIGWFQNYVFPKESKLLGPIKMNVTMVHAGTQHNIVPDHCTFTVDVRCTDAYTLEETLDTIRTHVTSEVTPRSARLKPSFISEKHPFVKAGVKAGRRIYGSPTTSDRALMPFPSVKLGPGDSARSHTADEYILLDEIREGIDMYISLLSSIVKK